jgi:hypothetical protein
MVAVFQLPRAHSSAGFIPVAVFCSFSAAPDDYGLYYYYCSTIASYKNAKGTEISQPPSL